MLEHRRRMHNRCENRRRTAIHQGLCQLRQLLDESDGGGRTRTATASFPEEEIPKRIHLSRPETLSRAVTRIEQLKASVARLKRQHQQLILEAQYLRRLSMGESVAGLSRATRGIDSIPGVGHIQGGKHVGMGGLNFAHGTWSHAGGTSLPRATIRDGSLPVQSLIPSPVPPLPMRPPSMLSGEPHQVMGHQPYAFTKGSDGTNGSDHQFIR